MKIEFYAPTFAAYVELLPAGIIPSALSGDGSTVIGHSSPATQAVRWTSAGGVVGLGQLSGGSNSVAYGVSMDGSVIVGGGLNAQGIQHAFRWSQADGMADLGVLPGNGARSFAADVSGDGSVVVGSAFFDNGSNSVGFRWTQADGMVGLGSPSSSARAVSADGSVIMGVAADLSGWWTYRWTQSEGYYLFPDPGFTFFSFGDGGISADGSTAVGSWVSLIESNTYL